MRPLFCCSSLHHWRQIRNWPIPGVERTNAVQKVAATELADYVGRITGQKLEIVSVSQLPGDAAGLSFFVGDAAKHALGKDPAPGSRKNICSTRCRRDSS